MITLAILNALHAAKTVERAFCHSVAHSIDMLFSPKAFKLGRCYDCYYYDNFKAGKRNY